MRVWCVRKIVSLFHICMAQSPDCITYTKQHLTEARHAHTLTKITPARPAHTRGLLHTPNVQRTARKTYAKPAGINAAARPSRPLFSHSFASSCHYSRPAVSGHARAHAHAAQGVGACLGREAVPRSATSLSIIVVVLARRTLDVGAIGAGHVNSLDLAGLRVGRQPELHELALRQRLSERESTQTRKKQRRANVSKEERRDSKRDEVTKRGWV